MLTDFEEEIWVDDLRCRKVECASKKKTNDQLSHTEGSDEASISIPPSDGYRLEQGPPENDNISNEKCFKDQAQEGVGGEEETVELPDDVYTMIYLAPWNHYAFWYAMLVFCIQVLILWLALVDLVADKPGNEDDNVLNVPPTGNTQVFVAQFLALLVAVLSQDDVTLSLYFTSIGLGQKFPEVQADLRQRYPKAATYWQYWLANFLRFTEGVFTILTSFVFIVQSETVLDIFLNFAAIHFVSELDNLGFRLGKEGWFGRRLQKLNKSIAREEIPIRKQKGCIDYFNQVFLALIVLTLFAGNALVVLRQDSGHYIKTDACTVLHVQFGDEVYTFPTTAKLQTYEVNGTLHVVDSTRYIANYLGNVTGPPDLHYAAFSGKYKPDFENKAGINNQRPVYYEASKTLYAEDLPHNDSSLGLFYYCEGENAWVWTVRAFLDAGAVPVETLEHCKYGWLLRSPITDAVTLEEAPTEGWNIWTGILSKTAVTSSCLECNSNIDCGLNRGTCGQDSVCHCHDYADGNFCNEDKACAGLVGFQDGQQEIGPYFTTSWYQMNGRPVYLFVETAEELFIIFYTGRQWMMTVGAGAQLALRDGNADGHSYWNSYLDLDYWYSEPTSNFLPTGSLQWYAADETRSDEGDYGTLGRTRKIPFDFRLSCLSVDCDHSNHVCGRFGTCVKDQILTVDGIVAYNFFDENKTFVGGKCKCAEGYYGHFCEFKHAQGNANHTNDEL